MVVTALDTIAALSTALSASSDAPIALAAIFPAFIVSKAMLSLVTVFPANSSPVY